MNFKWQGSSSTFYPKFLLDKIASGQERPLHCSFNLRLYPRRTSSDVFARFFEYIEIPIGLQKDLFFFCTKSFRNVVICVSVYSVEGKNASQSL